MLVAVLLINNAAGAQLLLRPFIKVPGPASKSIYSIFQDSKGYLWLGTEAGVSRYDGYSFTNFTRDDGLSDNDIFYIHEDYKGRIWFLTYNGEPTIYDHGKIRTATNCAFLKNVKPGTLASGFLNKGDSIWYMTLHKTYLFVGDRLIAIKELSAEARRNSWFNLNLLDYDHEVFCLNAGGIFSLTGKRNWRWGRRMDFHALLLKYQIVGKDLLLSGIHGIYRYNLASQRLDSFNLRGSKDRVRFLYPLNNDKDSFLLCSSAQLLLIDRYGRKLKELSALNMREPAGLLRDREGNVWFNTMGDGLYCYENTAIQRLNLLSNASSDPVYSLAVFKDKVYAGMTGEEYMICNNRPSYHNKAPVSPSANKVYGFYPDNDQLWMLGTNIRKANNAGREIKKIFGAVKAIGINKKDEIYIGFSYSVRKLDHKQDAIRLGKQVSTSSRLVFDKRVGSIYCKGKDSVYLAGLDKLHLMVNDRIVEHAFPPLPIFNTNATKVIAIGPEILFSTSGQGIGIITPDTFYAFNKTNGLTSNNCSSVFAENDSTVWVTTGNGLNKITYKIDGHNIHTRCEKYMDVDGLPASQLNDVVVLHDTVWVATGEGIYFFRKDAPFRKCPPPELVIDGISVSGRSYPVGQKIDLDYKLNNIAIDFTGISFRSRGHITYRYRLEGSETEWTTTSARHIEYPELPPGDYKFSFTAANAYMDWNEHPSSILFRISPPYWQTMWFRILMGVIALVMIGVVFKWQLKIQRHKHAQQQKALQLEKEKAEYEKLLIELEQHALRLQMNPHFIFNAITAIQGLYAANKPVQAKEYLVRFSRILRTIFETAREETISLSSEIELITDYIELNILRIDYRIDYKITVDPAINTELNGIAPMLLQPLVENALLHGLLPMKRPGRLDISLKRNDRTILCTIEDNGRGRQQHHTDIQNKPRGLSVTRHRIRLLNEAAGIEDIFVIEDLHDQIGQPSGTRVIFTTPLLSSYH